MPVYVVTGANRGLGLEFTRQLASNPSNTILATVRTAETDLSELHSIASATTHILPCDTSSASSISSFATSAATLLSAHNLQIDYLLNNAGTNTAPSQTSLSMTAEALFQNVQINVLGPAQVTSHLLAQNLLSPTVRIVNMSSGLGSMSVSLSISPRKCAPYSISKAGLNALTVQQSGEVREKLGGGAVVVCMDPGWVKTRMGGEGAVLEAEESIGGMLACVHGLGEGDNGRFFTYTGNEVPW